jgi:hypothetical protein
LGQAKLFNKNSKGEIEELSPLNNMSESLIFRLRQSFDLSDPNLSQYEIQISELAAKNIENKKNIQIDYSFYESNEITSRKNYLD